MNYVEPERDEEGWLTCKGSGRVHANKAIDVMRGAEADPTSLTYAKGAMANVEALLAIYYQLRVLEGDE